MALALYRKYRPQTFREITNQNHVKITLEREVAQEKVAHAYLFSGPRGTGKTSLARILAKAVNCQGLALDAKGLSPRQNGEPCNKCEACNTITEGRALDVIEIDAASYTGVDNVRETIVETAKFAPSRLKCKVFIIDEVHMLSNAAWNALLKIMEEPPAHVIFVLATTEVHKVPATILSRCQRFDFHRIRPSDMVARLKFIAAQEKVKVATPVLQSVARFAEGCVRDAESLLEQLFSLGEKEITEDVASLVLPRTSMPLALDLLECISAGEVRRALLLIGSLTDQGIDLPQFSSDLLELLRNVLLIKNGGKDMVVSATDASTFERLEKISDGWTMPRILFIVDTFVKAKQGLKGATIPQLPLEIAVVEAGEEGRAGQPEDLPRTRVGATFTLYDDSSRRAPARPASTTPLKETQISAGLREGSRQSSQPPVAPKVKRNENNNAVLSLQDLQAKWPEVLKRAQEENHSLPFLLSTSEPMRMEGDTIHVGVQYPFHCDKLNEPKSRAVLEKIVSDVYAMPLRIQGVISARPSEKDNSVEDVLKTLGGRLVG